MIKRGPWERLFTPLGEGLAELGRQLAQQQLREQAQKREDAQLVDRRAFQQGLAAQQRAIAMQAQAAQLLADPDTPDAMKREAEQLMGQLGGILTGNPTQAAQSLQGLSVPVSTQTTQAAPNLERQPTPQGVPSFFGATGAKPTETTTTTEQVNPLAFLARTAQGEREAQAAREEAEATTARQRALVENVYLPLIANVNTDPAYRQQLAQQIAAMPDGVVSPEIKESLQGIAGTVDPEGRTLREAAVEKARLGLEAARKKLDFMDLQYETADAELNAFYEETSDGRIKQFTETGTGLGDLTDEEQQEVAELYGVSIDQLGETGRSIFKSAQQAQQAERRYTTLRSQALEQDIKIGEQTYSIRAAEEGHRQWQRQREKALAPAQDAMELAKNIGSAVLNGDVTTLSLYQEALENPSSAFGQHLRELGVTEEAIGKHLAEAETIHTAEVARLQADADYAMTRADQAWLVLQQDMVLAPLETEALRAQYKLNAETAYRDLNNLLFNDQVDKASKLYTLAGIVPTEFWTNMPSGIRAQVETLDIDVEGLKSLSEIGEWLRKQPQRQAALERFMFLAKASPEDKAGALAGANQALLEADVTDDAVRTAMLGVLQGAWSMDDQSFALKWARLNATVATAAGNPEDTGLSVTDLKRVAGANNSLAIRQGDRVDEMYETLRLEGCLETYESNGRLRATFLPDAQAKSDGAACSTLIGTYKAAQQAYHNTINTQAQVTRAINTSIGLDLPVVTGASLAPTQAAPNSPVVQTIAGKDITQAQADAAQQIITAGQQGNQATVNRLAKQLVDQLGEEAAFALINSMKPAR